MLSANFCNNPFILHTPFSYKINNAVGFCNFKEMFCIRAIIKAIKFLSK